MVGGFFYLKLYVSLKYPQQILDTGPTNHLEDGKRCEGKDALAAEEGQHPLSISCPVGLSDCKRAHEGTSGGVDAVGEAVAELECLNCYLTGNAKDVSHGNHDGHNSSCLTGTGGDQEVDDHVSDEHEVSAKNGAHGLHGDGEPMNDGVEDLAVGKDDAYAVSEANDECSVAELSTTGNENLGGAVNAHAVYKAAENSEEEEGASHLVIAPAKLDGTNADSSNSNNETCDAEHMLAGHLAGVNSAFAAHVIRNSEAFLVVEGLLGVSLDGLHVTDGEVVADDEVDDIENYANAEAGEDGQLGDGVCGTNGGSVCPTNVEAGVCTHVNEQEACKGVISEVLHKYDADRNECNYGVSENACCAADGHEYHEYSNEKVNIELLVGSKLAECSVDSAALLEDLYCAAAEHDHNHELSCLVEACGNRHDGVPGTNGAALDNVVGACDNAVGGSYLLSVVCACGDDPGEDSTEDHHHEEQCTSGRDDKFFLVHSYSPF